MINIVYPIFIRDNHNYQIAVNAINKIAGRSNINIIFVINALDSEFDQIKKLADVVLERKVNNISGAWNDGLNSLKNLDYVLFVNQDLTLTVQDVEILLEAMYVHDFVTWDINDNSFSCFGGQVKNFKKVGAFDETYIRYHEDNDYHYRMRLMGKDLFSCGLNLHHVGSSVIKYDKDVRQNNNPIFEAGRRYYAKKWGGYINKEQFKTAFNE